MRTFVMLAALIALPALAQAQEGQDQAWLDRIMAAKAGEVLARYWQQGTSCQLDLELMDETFLLGDYFHDAARAEWNAGYQKGLDEFNRSFQVSPRMACAAAQLFMKDDLEFIRRLYASYQPIIGRKHQDK
jgi:hypothetical protein